MRWAALGEWDSRPFGRGVGRVDLRVVRAARRGVEDGEGLESVGCISFIWPLSLSVLEGGGEVRVYVQTGCSSCDDGEEQVKQESAWRVFQREAYMSF